MLGRFKLRPAWSSRVSSLVRLAVSMVILVVTILSPSRVSASQEDRDDIAEARRLLVEASHLVKDIPEIQQSSAAANIAGQLVRGGDLPDALTTARLLPKAEDQAQVAGSIAWGLAHNGDLVQALALVDGAADGQNKGVAYEMVAELRADAGDLVGALQIAHRIRKDPGRLVDTLARLASRAAKAGDLSRAREALADALQVTEEALKENFGYASSLAQIATTQAEIGDSADAFITLDRFSAIASQYKGGGNGMFLTELSCAQVQTGDLVGAERTADEIPQGGSSDLAFMCISKEQAKHGLMTEAIDTAARISSPAFKEATLQEIGISRTRQGSANDAAEVIDHIPEIARRAEALAALALDEAENKNPAAGGTLQMAWNLTTEMGADASDNLLGTIAVTRALLGDFAGAREIVQGLATSEARVWPLWNITSFMVAADHRREALALAESQEAAYPKAYALLGAAQGILDHLEAARKAQSTKH